MGGCNGWPTIANIKKAIVGHPRVYISDTKEVVALIEEVASRAP